MASVHGEAITKASMQETIMRQCVLVGDNFRIALESLGHLKIVGSKMSI